MKKLFLIFSFSLLLWGCKDETSPTDNLSTGNIAGVVDIKDTPENNNSGVKVNIDGTSYSAVSESDGKWKIENIPAGIYDITFSKVGYFTYKYYNFQFVGNGTYYFSKTTMAPVPPVYVTQLSAKVIDSTKSILFEGKLSSNVQKPQTVVVLISKRNISNSFPVIFEHDVVYFASAGSSSFKIYYSPGYYDDIKKGDTLYAIAYGGDEMYIVSNYNPINSLYEFNTSEVKLSNTVSFIVP